MEQPVYALIARPGVEYAYYGYFITFKDVIVLFYKYCKLKIVNYNCGL